MFRIKMFNTFGSNLKLLADAINRYVTEPQKNDSMGSGVLLLQDDVVAIEKPTG